MWGHPRRNPWEEKMAPAPKMGAGGPPKMGGGSGVDEIAAMAAALGKVEDSEELRSLCAWAAKELEGMLRSGLTPQDCGEAFVLAAAWMALAELGLCEDEVESFTAGEVSIRKKGGEERRQALRERAREVMGA